MMARYCISILIFTLTLFGVVSQQQTTLPNQEIVLQFTEVDLTSEDAQNTITFLKKQLRDLGAENIQVNRLDNGNINIAYFSSANAASIKKNLLHDRYLTLDVTSNSEKKGPLKESEKNDTVCFNFDVFEIQQDYGQTGDLNGNLVFQVKTKSDRFLDPNINLGIQQNGSKNLDVVLKVSYSVCKNMAIAIKNIPHSIPEGRAGPAIS